MDVKHPFGFMADGVKGDYRWMGPTGECLCGCGMFAMLAVFDDETRLPGFFLTDGLCVACNALVRLPTPVDQWPDGTPMLALAPMQVPVTIDLTCPQCGSAESTVVISDEGGHVIAVCQGAQCMRLPFDATREV